MNERKKGLAIISLLLGGVGFIFINSASLYQDSQMGFGIFLTLVALVCSIISLVRMNHQKVCAVIGLIICILSIINFNSIQEKKQAIEKEKLARESITYTITFDSDGGTYVEPMTVNMNTWLTEPTEPTKEGFVFDGWNYNGKKFLFNRYVNDYVTEDVTLKAIWIREQTSNLSDSGHEFIDNSSNNSQGTVTAGNGNGSNINGNNSSQTSTVRGYQQIYDEYAEKLRKAGPTSSITEMAEICNDGVYEMARYMYSAKGTEGQYATYESWAEKLFDVYMNEVR